MSCISLVVEDQADIRKLIRMTLEFENHEIHEVADAPSALTFAAGADAYVLKPFSPLKLLDTIHACLGAPETAGVAR
jgi:CheY-like chemotaxis protein